MSGVCGYPLLEKQFFGVNLLLRGIERKIKKPAPPITPDLLILIHSVLDFRKPFEVMMWALFLTCFFLMLRTTVTPTSPVLDEKILRRRDFKRGINGYLVKVHSTKTLQDKSRKIEQPLFWNVGNILCPVAALDKMFQVVPAYDDVPAFCTL